jgi:alpha-beta hydrolase superfamily lysophospholipase
MPSLWVKGPLGTEFYVNSFPAENAKACIIFCHGFIEHIDRYSDIFPLYTQRGISVVCFDQRGFGRTACDKEHNNVCLKWTYHLTLNSSAFTGRNEVCDDFQLRPETGFGILLR